MKIATYNIWNHDKEYNQRMNLLIGLIREKEIDILVLQEVRDELIVKRIASECDYKYSHWKKYFDCQEGLAILSKYQIDNTWTNWDDNEYDHNSGAMYIRCEVAGNYIDIMNVHLDYEKASQREAGIIEASEFLDKCEGDYKFLLGDFNTIENSSVYRFLTSGQSLNGCDASWIDLAKSYCYRRGIELEATIDFVNNPRWLDGDSIEVPSRFDWIFIEEPYPNDNPKLIDYKVFGKQIHNGITPSDHYGVMVELELL